MTIVNPGWEHVVGKSPYGIMTEVLRCGLKVSKSELKSHYYVHFQTNNLGEDMNPLSTQLWVK